MPFSREKHAKSNRKAFSSPISQENVPILAGTLRWAQFLSDEKLGKESPKAGPSPALWNPPRGTGCLCVLLFAPLGSVGSHRWRGHATESTRSSVWLYFYRQGLTLVCNCSQLPGAGRKKPLNIAEFLALLGVGEGLAPPESPRAIQGNQRAGQATALTAAQQDGAAKPPAAGTPLLQSRPGGGNHPVIGPVAMVAWCGGRDRGHSKGDGPNTSLTH